MQAKSGSNFSSPLLPPQRSALEQFRGFRYGAFIRWNPATLIGAEFSWSRNQELPYEQYDSLFERFDPAEFDAKECVRTLVEGVPISYVCGEAPRWLRNVEHRHYTLQYYELYDREGCCKIALACREQGMPLCLYQSIADFYHPDCINAGSVDYYSGACFERWTPINQSPMRQAFKTHREFAKRKDKIPPSSAMSPI